MSETSPLRAALLAAQAFMLQHLGKPYASPDSDERNEYAELFEQIDAALATKEPSFTEWADDMESRTGGPIQGLHRRLIQEGWNAHARASVTDTEVLDALNEIIPRVLVEPPPPAPSLAERLGKRILVKHGGTGDPWRDHWNLTENDSLLHKDALAAIKHPAATPEQMRANNRLGVHLSHCNFGEHEGRCKYHEDADCPALSDSWSWFGKIVQERDRLREGRDSGSWFSKIAQERSDSLREARNADPMAVRLDRAWNSGFIRGHELARTISDIEQALANAKRDFDL